MILGGKLFRAPIATPPQRCLDIGTGTGIWAIDFADEFPSCQVLGTDLSPIQPPWVPPNCTFEIDDCESEWPYHVPFDFIHTRSMAGSIRDYNQLFKQGLRHLTPGGWMEMQDFEIWIYSETDAMERAPFIREWQQLLDEASTKFGKKLNVSANYKDWMMEAGFIDVSDDVYKVRTTTPTLLLPSCVDGLLVSSRPVAEEQSSQGARHVRAGRHARRRGSLHPGIVYPFSRLGRQPHHDHVCWSQA